MRTLSYFPAAVNACRTANGKSGSGDINKQAFKSVSIISVHLRHFSAEHVPGDHGAYLPGARPSGDGTLDVRLLRVSDSTVRIGVARGERGSGLEGLAPSCGQLTRCFSAVAELLVLFGKGIC